MRRRLLVCEFVALLLVACFLSLVSVVSAVPSTEVSSILGVDKFDTNVGTSVYVGGMWCVIVGSKVCFYGSDGGLEKSYSLGSGLDGIFDMTGLYCWGTNAIDHFITRVAYVNETHVLIAAFLADTPRQTSPAWGTILFLWNIGLLNVNTLGYTVISKTSATNGGGGLYTAGLTAAEGFVLVRLVSETNGTSYYYAMMSGGGWDKDSGSGSAASATRLYYIGMVHSVDGTFDASWTSKYADVDSDTDIHNTNTPPPNSYSAITLGNCSAYFKDWADDGRFYVITGNDWVSDTRYSIYSVSVGGESVDLVGSGGVDNSYGDMFVSYFGSTYELMGASHMYAVGVAFNTRNVENGFTVEVIEFNSTAIGQELATYVDETVSPVCNLRPLGVYNMAHRVDSDLIVSGTYAVGYVGHDNQVYFAISTISNLGSYTTFDVGEVSLYSSENLLDISYYYTSSPDVGGCFVGDDDDYEGLLELDYEGARCVFEGSFTTDDLVPEPTATPIGGGTLIEDGFLLSWVGYGRTASYVQASPNLNLGYSDHTYGFSAWVIKDFVMTNAGVYNITWTDKQSSLAGATASANFVDLTDGEYTGGNFTFDMGVLGAVENWYVGMRVNYTITGDSEVSNLYLFEFYGSESGWTPPPAATGGGAFPSPSPGASDNEVLIWNIMNVLVYLVVLIVPAVILGHPAAIGLGAFGYLFGLVLGASLGVLFITGFPVWILFGSVFGMVVYVWKGR